MTTTRTARAAAAAAEIVTARRSWSWLGPSSGSSARLIAVRNSARKGRNDEMCQIGFVKSRPAVQKMTLPPMMTAPSMNSRAKI